MVTCWAPEPDQVGQLQFDDAVGLRQEVLTNPVRVGLFAIGFGSRTSFVR
jgi:hypothetical protein